ncbi:hypothetical protein N0B31_02460 [Salinirubellus salinus]|uniref:DUF7321 domain-containing protein n=1 Tax=Salinirubellus salinus TaxID=1364945 RepID=A0A9E7R3W9_9EURY|nr:hypothetical protein [Salinirubellus salinus]UWM55152.1 hypothetical protein N0B31_02460 [Salinirubellus salinus]
MLPDATVAALTAIAVSAALPLFLYGAWIMIDAEAVTWGVLTYHLKFILTGLTLTTVPMVFWMVPRLFGLAGHPGQFGGLATVHAFLGLTAYAFLLFGFTGIVRIFRAKWEHDLYHDYDEDVLLEEIGSERMSHWRSRLRLGVFGYTFFWIGAWLTGLGRFVVMYVL